ncbi:MAG TPA: MmgE/PrpD family protein, partial [Lachnospiraceae bacterium]|nr:MmgE/PrpD family protein [Lachnospiraceae bacterium]
MGSEKTFNLPGAVVAMSHASNSFDIDDGHNMIKGHPGTSFVAGVLSAALAKQCSYEEYLAALAVTYEVTIRFGLAEQDHYGYLHSTG